MDAQQILAVAQQAITVRRVFGDPIQAEGVTIVPVATVQGAGRAGRGGQEAGGAGYGLRARPAGGFVVRDGEVSWRPAVNVNLIVAGGQLVAIAALFALRPLLARWFTSSSSRRAT